MVMRKHLFLCLNFYRCYNLDRIISMGEKMNISGSLKIVEAFIAGIKIEKDTSKYNNLITPQSANAHLQAKGKPKQRKITVSHPELVEKVDLNTGVIYLKSGDTLREIGKFADFEVEYSA